MYQAPEQLMAWNKAYLETAVRFAGIALDGAERVLELQLKAAKNAFADGVEQAKALAAAKDPQEFAQLKNTLAQPNLEKATSYVKSVYDAAAATQSEISKLIDEQVAEYNRNVATGLDKMAKSAPAGSEMAVTKWQNPPRPARKSRLPRSSQRSRRSIRPTITCRNRRNSLPK